MDIETEDARYNVEVVERFSQIMGLFTIARGAVTLREIATALEIPERSTAKIVGTMVHHGFLVGLPAEKKFAPGFVWLRLADLRRRHMNIRDIALPVMRQIRDRVNETVILCIRAGTRRVHVDYAESTQPVRRVPQTAFSESPLHVGSAGRTLLAGMQDEDIDAYLANIEPVKYGYRTLTEPKRIWKDVLKVREEGYIVAVSEITKDTASVSAPIKDYAGKTLASLTLTCPIHRFLEPHSKTCIGLIDAGAKKISASLGHAS